MASSHGILKASLYDPSSGTVVQLNSLLADGTSASIDQPADNPATNVYGLPYDGPRQSDLRLEYLDTTAGWTLADQIATWDADETPIRMVAYGAAFGIQWYEDVTVQSHGPVEFASSVEGRVPHFVELFKRSGTHTIYQQQNLLAHLAAASGSSYDQTIAFPIEGATLTLAATLTGSGTITITAKTQGGSQLGQTVTNVSDARDSAALELPGNTYDVQCQASDTAVSDVSLRVDGGTTYTAY